MRISRPSPALVISCIALLLAAGGTAVASIKATGTATNIVDPVTATNIAKVDSVGKLTVGDGNGPLSIDGYVYDRTLPPSSPWRISTVLIGDQVTFVLGPGPLNSAVDVTSMSISVGPGADTGDSYALELHGFSVASTATNCQSATHGAEIWQTSDLGDGVTPLVVTFPTPLQWKPPANTKACLAINTFSNNQGFISNLDFNASGYYGT